MATITTINWGDDIKDSRDVINTNFDNLNTELVAIDTDVIWYNDDTWVITYAWATIAPTNTQVRVTAWTGRIWGNPISWNQEDVTALNIATQDQGHLYIDSAWDIQQQNTPLTSAQRRANIYLWRWASPNNTNIAVVQDETVRAVQKWADFQDYARSIGLINEGIRFLPDGANLSIQRIAWVINWLGLNITDTTSPNKVSISAANPTTLWMATQNAPSWVNVTVVDVANYDLNWTVTAVWWGVNSSQNIRLIQYASWNTLAFYWQQVYSSLDDAIANLWKETIVKSDIEKSWILIAVIATKRSTANFNTVADAIFTPATKFGDISTSNPVSSTVVTEFLDTEFRVFDNTDNSKKVAFETSWVTTSTTRTITIPDANWTLVLEDNTATLTNKRITTRVNTITSSATPTPAWDSTDEFIVTALAVNATFAAPTGTPTDWQVLLIRIKDNATDRTLAWNTIYRASSDLALPTTTIISKTLYLQFVYNSADAKFDLLWLLNNF